MSHVKDGTFHGQYVFELQHSEGTTPVAGKTDPIASNEYVRPLSAPVGSMAFRARRLS